MEPNGKLRYTQTGPPREKSPGGSIFAVCEQTCGQEVLERKKEPKFVLEMGLFEQ